MFLVSAIVPWLQIIQKLCSSIFFSVDFVDWIFIWMENRARWIENNLEFSEPKNCEAIIYLFNFVCLFFTLIGVASL